MGTRIFFAGYREKFDPGIAEFVILEFEQNSECGLLIDAVEVGSSGVLLWRLLADSVAMKKDQPDLRFLGPRLLCALTRQERLVLDLIATGLTNREIGDRMHVKKKTIKNYVSQVLRKIGLKIRTTHSPNAPEDREHAPVKRS